MGDGDKKCTRKLHFDLSSHVIVKRSNITKEITGNDKKMCLMGVVCKVLNRKTFSAETFFFPDKRFLSIFFASSNSLFFYKLLFGPQQIFSECIVVFL